MEYTGETINEENQKIELYEENGELIVGKFNGEQAVFEVTEGEDKAITNDLYILDVELIDKDIYFKTAKGENLSINLVSENVENYYYFIDTHNVREETGRLYFNDIFDESEYLFIDKDFQNGNYSNSKTNTFISFFNIDGNYNKLNIDVVKPINEFLDYKGLSELKKENYSTNDILNIKEIFLELENSNVLKKTNSNSTH